MHVSVLCACICLLLFLPLCLYLSCDRTKANVLIYTTPRPWTIDVTATPTGLLGCHVSPSPTHMDWARYIREDQTRPTVGSGYQTTPRVSPWEPVLKTTIVTVGDGDKDRYSKLHRNTASAKNEAIINFACHTFSCCATQDRKGYRTFDVILKCSKNI